jgi:ABC-type uncharacterized transport system permease subunit
MWSKTWRLLPTYFWLSLLRSSEFKFSFYSYIFLYGSQIVFYIFFWRAVAPPPSSGWSVEACIMLTGFGTMNIALQEIVWATGMVDQLIVSGELNVVLVRPENSYFGLVLRRLGAMAILPAMMGLVLVISTAITMDNVDFLNLLAACFCCLLGAICMRSVMLSVNSLGFTFGRITSLKSIVYSSRDFSRYPIDLLPTSLRVLMCTALPVLFMSNWPTLLAQGASNTVWTKIILITSTISAIWVWLCSKIWKAGLSRYEGQSL